MADVSIGEDLFSEETIASLPDIQTVRPIASYLKKFYEIINKKTLSDIQKFVHNAGRYNSGALVRVDQGAIDMTLTDEVAIDTLHATNSAIEERIDTHILSNNYARKILILDAIKHIIPLPE